ncbi:MAG TPA: TonB-dependent receptor [Thermovirgaceae bacterium]|jgi:iron complex outermembrane receptor protein/vitamin B12 transporter|nr:TonB-dependent receptor [Thermovirgaceae bacterium]
MRKVFGVGFTVFAAIAFVLAGYHGVSAEVTTVAPEVVTGSRIYTDLNEVPAPAYVITAEDIAASGASDLGALLDSRIPGIFMKKKSGVAQQSQIWFRGFTNQVLVLSNGIPLYSSSIGVDFGAVDFRSFALEDIERIEVVKGGASAIYGSMAAGGVINIITKKPEKPGGKVVAEAGPSGWRRYYVSGNTGGDVLNAGIWYERVEEGRKRLFYDTSPTNRYDSLGYKGDAYGLNLSGKHWIFKASWGDYKYQYEGNWTAFNDEKKTYSRYSFRYDWDNWYLLTGYDTQRYDILQNPNNYFEDSAYTAEVGGKSALGEALVAWGLYYRREDTEFKDDGAVNPVVSKDRYNLAPFIEASYPLGEWVANLGLRYEIWRQDSNDHDELIPKLSLQRQFANGNMIYISASRVFAMPTFYMLFADYDMGWGDKTVGNPDLKPEKGWSYELGLKGIDLLEPWQIGVFLTVLDEKIKYDYRFPFPSTYINVAEFRTYGIEATKKWKLGTNWTLGLNGTWQMPEEKATATSDWVRSTAVPEWEIGGSLEYKSGPWTALLIHSWSGNQGNRDSDHLSQVDLALSWESEVDTVRLNLINVFGKENIFEAGFGSYYYGPERGIKLSWERRF